MVGSSYLYLKSVSWRQEVRHYPGIKVEGAYLSTTCVPSSDCEILLSNKGEVRNYQIDLGVLPGELSAEEKPRFLPDAFGGLFFVAAKSRAMGHLRGIPRGRLAGHRGKPVGSRPRCYEFAQCVEHDFAGRQRPQTLQHLVGLSSVA